jgi:signal transduction histidine kinase
MRDKAPFKDKEGSLRAWIYFVVVTGLALVADAYPVELLPGSFFTLRMAAILGITAKLGTMPGMIAQCLVWLVLPNRIGNTIPLLVGLLETLFVGLVRNRRPRTSLLAINAVFWPLFGIPAFAVAYPVLLGISPETTFITFGKIWLTGLVNAQIADIASDSRIVASFLGSRAPGRKSLGDFLKDRVSLILLPISIVGLFVSVLSIRKIVEDHLESRLRDGVAQVHLVASVVGRDAPPAATILRSLAANSFDHLGRYEIVEGPHAMPPKTSQWREGVFASVPPTTGHPTDSWRASTYFIETDFQGLRLRYSVAFEPFFLDIYRFYVSALALTLLFLYAVFALLAHAAFSLSRRTRVLIDVAGSLPEKIEAGKDLTWPSTDIEELEILTDEFRTVTRELSTIFAQLKETRDSLEATVKERTRELEGLSEEIRLLLARVESEREAERMRVARELHDEFGQVITGLGMALNILERRLGPLDERGKEKFSDMKKAISDLSEGVRRLIADLRPSVLDRLGLSEALAKLAETSCQGGLEVTYSDSVPPDFSPTEDFKTAVYRVAQEAVRNALKYSHSPVIRMNLTCSGASGVLEVSDSGVGFAVDSIKSGEDRIAFGLIGMRERCRALGGDFQLHSAPGSGTSIRAAFPYTKKDE